jgi:antitoxin component HigA of HigAB toxin-antitoxin module
MAPKDQKNDKEEAYARLLEQESLILEATEMIEELLEESGVNRKELAEKLGRSKGFVSHILAGDRNMTLRTLSDFAYALEHRVKMAAVPLLEKGHGGSASPATPTSRARVWEGASEPLATRCPASAGNAPQRPLAAEGIAGAHAYVAATAGFFAAPDELSQLHLEPLPLTLPAELETVAG